MLANPTTINGTEQVIYTVPDGRTALCEIFIWVRQVPNDVVLKINNVPMLEYSFADKDLIQFKVTLNENDTVAVSSTAEVNAAVAGLLV